MRTFTAHDAYSTVTATTADPVTLTTMLYDGAVKALKRAHLFGSQGDRQRLVTESEKAHLIVGELLATLDMEQGELPRRLASIYTYCMRITIEGSMGDLPKLQEAERHITLIADSWKAATATLRTGAPALESAESVA